MGVATCMGLLLHCLPVEGCGFVQAFNWVYMLGKMLYWWLEIGCRSCSGGSVKGVWPRKTFN